MHIREATINDVPAVMSLVTKVVPLMRASGNLQWDAKYPNSAVFERDVALGQLWLAESNGKLAGVAAITTTQEPEYAQVWDTSETAIVVHRLAVDPDFQGQGVAAELMKKAERLAHEREIATLRVDTNTNNLATQRLFPKLGYVLCGEISLAFRDGLRFLCFEKRVK